MEIVIVDTARTAIGNFLGTLATVPASRLGARTIEAVINKSGIGPDEVNEVVMGNVLTAGLGQNPARQAAIHAGIPNETMSFTVNKVCGSGLKAVALAAQSIKAGDAEIVIAGGMENMSRAPFLLRDFRNVKKFRNFKADEEVMRHLTGKEFVDTAVYDGIWCYFNDILMGNLTEFVAEKYGISRREQDGFSFESHMKAVKAIENGNFKDEIVPLEVGDRIFDTDERPRKDTSVEKLSKLEPAFKKDGTITAGNSCGMNDGAAALLVMSSGKCDELGLRPLARIESYASAGVEPKWFGLAPIYAVRKIYEKTGRKTDDYDLFEVNEPFAAAALAVQKDLGIASDRLNVNGGAIALGHPIGGSGARILVTLLNALRERKGRLGMATLCLGGGGAVAMSVEMI